MGKAKKLKISGASRHTPLQAQMEKGEFAEPTGRVKDRGERRKNETSTEDYIDGKLSEKILRQARMQVMQLEDDEAGSGGKKILKKTVELGGSDDDEEEEEEEVGGGRRDGDLDGAGFAEKIGVSAKDEEAFTSFGGGGGGRQTLAHLIEEKIREKRTEIETRFSEAQDVATAELDPRVVEMYEGVGKILCRYRSGKLPKAFKVMPQFRNWEELLLLTRPDTWSAAAVYQATRVFTAGLKEKMAQRFFNQILLPRVRDDVDTYQRLNFHLYQAIRKALFKPGAFFKGFLLPLCTSGDCTLREAVIVGSVLARCSIPVLHASAVMLKIAEMEYAGANSIFLRVFFDKKYALPFRVVDSVVFHFLRFRSEARRLPVLWHQALLTFVQRYKGHVSSEQREALLELLKHQVHHGITPEIRRELVHAKCRDQEVDQPMPEPP